MSASNMYFNENRKMCRAVPFYFMAPKNHVYRYSTFILYTPQGKQPPPIIVI